MRVPLTGYCVSASANIEQDENTRVQARRPASDHCVALVETGDGEEGGEIGEVSRAGRWRSVRGGWSAAGAGDGGLACVGDDALAWAEMSRVRCSSEGWLMDSG